MKLRKNASLSSVAAATRKSSEKAWKDYRKHNEYLLEGTGITFDYRCRVEAKLALACELQELAEHLERLAE